MATTRTLIGLVPLSVGLLLALATYYLSFGAGVMEPFARATAEGLAAVLGLLGQDAQVQGITVTAGGFSLFIAPGCTPVPAALLYLGAVAGYPSTLGAKVHGALVGVLALVCINYVRVTTLFFVGKYSPDNLPLMHVLVWQVLLVLATLGLWLYWVRHHASPSSEPA